MIMLDSKENKPWEIRIEKVIVMYLLKNTT